jgi:hypothetical protein
MNKQWNSKEKVEIFKGEYGVFDHKIVTETANRSLCFVTENWFMSKRQNITNCRFYLQAGLSGLESLQWQEALSKKPSKLALVPTQTSTHWVPDFFPWRKRLGRQTDSSPSTSAKVKCEWRHIYSPSAYIHVFFVVNIVIWSDILAIWACMSCYKNYTDLCLPGLPASQRKIKSRPMEIII